jgi:hypothetical protein
MPENPTPGQIAYTAYMAVLDLSFPMDFAALPDIDRLAWEAAAQAVLAQSQTAMPLLYVVVMEEGGQIQLCGAYHNAEEAGRHVAHARTVMPERHVDMRVCPFALTGKARRIPTLNQVQRRLCRWCGQPIAAHPQAGEAWRCRLSDGPLLPKEDTYA